MACGLPGTGKSSLMETLGARFGWPVVASDAVRKALAGVAEGEQLPDECYNAAFSDRTYEAMAERAVELGRDASTVVLDANFRSRMRRAAVREAAERAGAALLVVHVATGEGTVRERLEERPVGEGSLSDADWAVYQKLKETFEEPSVVEGIAVVTVDGGSGIEEQVETVLMGAIEEEA